MKIEIKNLSKKFKKTTVFSNVNITINGGDIYGLYAKNGSGKSVLLKIIAGFYHPTDGTVSINGINYIEKREFYPYLRCLIENPNFFPDLTGYENLKLLAKMNKIITEDNIIDALKIVNLLKEKDKKYKYYSLGMKQKLGIAQAIMEKPKILLLDEPFNSIEKETVKDLIKYLKKYSKKDNIIILSSHDKEELKELCNKIYYIDEKEEK